MNDKIDANDRKVILVASSDGLLKLATEKYMAEFLDLYDPFDKLIKYARDKYLRRKLATKGDVELLKDVIAALYLLQAKNGESCKTKIHKVAIGKSIKLQTLLHA